MLLTMYFFFGYIDIAYAKQHHARQNCSQTDISKSNGSPLDQKGGSNQKDRSGEKNRKYKIQKPERNRIGDGKKKKTIIARKRKKARKVEMKKSRNKKSDSNTSSCEDVARDIKRKKKQVDVIKTERVDDIPILINVLSKMGVQQGIDKYVVVQRNQRDLSWGWTAVIWLAYILTMGDHRKVSVQEYVRNMQNTLSKATGMSISDLDFTDDRLTILAKYLSDEKYWPDIEQAVSENSIEVYELPKEVVRVDATTASGFHETAEGELFQFGHSKDDPDRPQIKIMTGSLDPMGMPLATDVVSGEKSDDGLYSPIISRISRTLNTKGLLYVGDCKLSSLDNRLHIKEKAHGHYLCPLPNTGKVPEDMIKWIDEGNRKDQRDELIKYVVVNNKGEDKLKAKGYEIKRKQSGEIEGKEVTWSERVLIVKSPAHELQQKKGLERRLDKVAETINALTPPRGPGKRQITDEKTLIKSVEAVLKKYNVDGLIAYEYMREVEKKTKYIGRGRGSAEREKKIDEKVRYQITKLSRNDVKINEVIKIFGWKAYVTNVSEDRLRFVDVVRSYRQQYRVERIFNRLKSRLNIAPLYVRRDEQIKGITHLLMLGVRVYTLIEFVVRRSLLERNQKLLGLHLESSKKETDIPTCERLLKAFSNITLTVFEIGGNIQMHITPLSQLQLMILNHLKLDSNIYMSLEEIQKCQI